MYSGDMSKINDSSIHLLRDVWFSEKAADFKNLKNF